MSVARRRRRTFVGGGFADGFDANSAGLYTFGGDGAGVWTFNTGSSQLESMSGNQSTMIRTGFSSAAPYSEIDTNQGWNGGLIIHYIDNLNYYVASLVDDTIVASGVNVNLYCRSVGTFNPGPTLDFVFTRGVNSTLRLAREGGNIVFRSGGVALLTWADTTFTSAGGVGLYQHTAGPSFIQALRGG